jgi:amino acid transporter, AAT family
MIYMNTLAVENFGTIEYWFAMIKVVTVAAFLIIGAAIVFGTKLGHEAATNYTALGGFFPHGWSGAGLGVTIAIFSYLGLEVVASTAGEAVDPQTAVPRALRRTLFTLALFYVGGLAIVVAIVPWTQIGLGESPFVRVFEIAGLPAAKHIMNFVVLSAALSSATCNLYFCSRLLFSLSRGTYAPAIFGKLSKRGMPVPAVLASSVGMAAALLLEHFFQNTAFVFMIGVAFFGGPFVWAMTLVTHVAFRRKMADEGRSILKFSPLGIWGSVVGAVALVAVLISTWWVPAFHVALLAGPPWLLFVTGCYWVWKKRARVG